MNRRLLRITTVITLLTTTRRLRSADAQPLPPAAPVRPVVDNYFGTKITDPYRWMEDMKNPELLGWMKAQADYTRTALDDIPGRRAVLNRLTELSNAVPARVSSVLRLPNEQYVYLKTGATENLASLYVRHGLAGPEIRLVDPNQLKPTDGQLVSISHFAPSWNGRLMAVGLASGGSENSHIRIYDVKTGRETGETIDRARYGGIAWLPDNRSFFYTRMQQLPPDAPVMERQQKKRVYRHVVGPPGTPPTTNLTRGKNGIGDWSEADFVRALRTGKHPNAQELHASMPWRQTALMTDNELHAIWLYLRSVPPRPFGNN